RRWHRASAAPSGTAPPWCPRAGVRSGRAARGSAGEERSGERRCHAGSACSWGERAISGSSMVARRDGWRGRLLPMSASDPSDQKFLLIDGHAMAFRAFFALPADGFSDGRGQATNAVYGFTRMIINVVASEQPTHVAVAFDLPGGTFRDRIY